MFSPEPKEWLLGIQPGWTESQDSQKRHALLAKFWNAMVAKFFILGWAFLTAVASSSLNPLGSTKLDQLRTAISVQVNALYTTTVTKRKRPRVVKRGSRSTCAPGASTPGEASGQRPGNRRTIKPLGVGVAQTVLRHLPVEDRTHG